MILSLIRDVLNSVASNTSKLKIREYMEGNGAGTPSTSQSDIDNIVLLHNSNITTSFTNIVSKPTGTSIPAFRRPMFSGNRTLHNDTCSDGLGQGIQDVSVPSPDTNIRYLAILVPLIPILCYLIYAIIIRVRAYRAKKKLEQEERDIEKLFRPQFLKSSPYAEPSRRARAADGAEVQNMSGAESEDVSPKTSPRKSHENNDSFLANEEGITALQYNTSKITLEGGDVDLSSGQVQVIPTAST